MRSADQAAQGFCPDSPRRNHRARRMELAHQLEVAAPGVAAPGDFSDLFSPVSLKPNDSRCTCTSKARRRLLEFSFGFIPVGMDRLYPKLILRWGAAYRRFAQRLFHGDKAFLVEIVQRIDEILRNVSGRRLAHVLDQAISLLLR